MNYSVKYREENEPHKNHQILKPGSGLIRGSFATNMSSSVTNSFDNDNYDSNRLSLYQQHQQNFCQIQSSFFSKNPEIKQDDGKLSQLNTETLESLKTENDNEIFQFRVNNQYNTVNQMNTQTNFNSNQYQHQQQLIEAFNNQYKQQLSNQSVQYHPSGLLTSEHVHYQQKRTIKKSRVLFSQWQINELEKLFKKQKYVTSNERDLMAKKLRLHANQVKIWFQNRRYKIKKKNEAIGKD